MYLAFLLSTILRFMHMIAWIKSFIVEYYSEAWFIIQSVLTIHWVVHIRVAPNSG